MTNSSEHRHVAVLPFPFSTHAAPILSIIRRLATAAPNITFSFLSTPQSIQTLFPSRGNPENNNVIPYAVSDGVPEGYVFSGRHHEDINLFLAGGKASFEAGMRVAEADIGRRIDCVVADAFMWFSCELAEEMGVPWVTLWVSGACSLVAHCCTDLIRETVGMHDTAGRENEIVKFVPGYSEVRLGDLPSGVVYGNLDSPFSMMLYKMGQVLQKATAVAINSFDELEPEPIEVLESKFQKLLTCGPFNSISPTPSSKLDEYGCIPWLDQHKAASVAYIGFGSVATPPPVEIAALAEALEASSTPFLWSLRENFKLHLPEGFLKRTSELGKIVPWAPQVQVLAHSSIGVFINHCGWNSVVESIEAGVPIIGRPFFGDHQVDTWMVENVWKIGVRVEGGVFTRSSTMSALELVLSHEKGKEMREQIGKYKEFALKAFGPKGRSTQNLNTLLEIVAGYNL